MDSRSNFPSISKAKMNADRILILAEVITTKDTSRLNDTRFRSYPKTHFELIINWKNYNHTNYFFSFSKESA